ncbi:hypothetical protein DDF62_17170 [Caulobacter radicis]|uniref:OmpA family protein n=1 Tax=Caulobacter radicis TaxID=2172650 RepID=UPI000D586CA4|nr:OmpA family protein [Caulobacter radicis]PVM86786.1 hypothetical protein DDF62_17170 [Caulobacter radicis]
MGVVLRETLRFGDAIRGQALQSFGPHADVVIIAVELVATVFAIWCAVAGRGPWAPPLVGPRQFSIRLAGAVSLFAVAALHVVGQDPNPTVSFLTLAAAGALAVLVFGLAYGAAYSWLTFRCEGDRRVYLRGFKVCDEAKRVLANPQDPSLPPHRRIPVGGGPTDELDYFSKSNRDRPEYIWTRGSLLLAGFILRVLYLVLVVSVVVMATSAALAVQQVNTRIVVSPGETVAKVPTDVLFEFGKDQLKPGAEERLKPVVSRLRDRTSKDPVLVVGHTDGIGGEASNMALSRRRATAVAQWLATSGGLATTAFTVEGRGEAEPIAPNVLPNGDDNPEGRRMNRRVVVRIPTAD